MSEKELMFCKYCFELLRDNNYSLDCFTNLYNNKKIFKFHLELFHGSSFLTSCEIMARFYAVKILEIDEDLYKEMIIHNHNNERYIEKIFQPFTELILRYESKNTYNRMKNNNWKYNLEEGNIYDIRNLTYIYAKNILGMSDYAFNKIIENTFETPNGKNFNLSVDEFVNYLIHSNSIVGKNYADIVVNKAIINVSELVNNRCNIFEFKRFLKKAIVKHGNKQSLLEKSISNFDNEDNKHLINNIKYSFNYFINIISVDLKSNNDFYEKSLLNDFIDFNIDNYESLINYCSSISVTISDLENSIFKLKDKYPDLVAKAKHKLNKFINIPKNKPIYSEKVKLLGKKYYEYFKKVNFDERKLYDITDHNIDNKKIRNYIKQYMINELDYSERDFYCIIYQNTKRVGKFFMLFEELSDASNNDIELINIFERYFTYSHSDISNHKVNDAIYPYALYRTSRNETNWRGLEADLRNKVDRYRMLRKEKIKNKTSNEIVVDKELLEKVKKFAEKFIETDLKLNDYLNINNITINTYNTYRNILEENYPELFAKLELKNSHSSSAYFYTILKIGKEIAKFIKTGIKNEDGTLRKFDLLDYYTRIKISPDYLLRLIRKKLSNEEYVLYRTFMARYKNDKGLNIGDTINSKHIINNREVTFDEKWQAINYLKENNMPITNSLYNSVIKRIISDNLYPNKKSKK